MKLLIDESARTLTLSGEAGIQTLDLYSDEAFDALSRVWLKVGWNQKYSYTFSWFGRPIIQLPEDMIRAQEVIYRVRPDVILETGVAHGGSLVFYASLCRAMAHGRVVGVDLTIRQTNRNAIESHELGSLITLVEGNSVADSTLAAVRSHLKPGERVLVFLDSNHSSAHVLAELEKYSEFVAPGSYIVATDGIMKDLHDVPRGQAEWDQDNPVNAVQAFLRTHSEFQLEQPAWPFNESGLRRNLTHWPEAWLRRELPASK